MAHTADVVIIGGGVMGTSIAFHLSRRHAGRVALLERRFLSAGSSGKSGAIIRQHYSHPLTTTMARQSLKFFDRFEDEVGGPRVFTRAGMAIVVPPRDRPRLEANVEMQRGVGVDVQLIAPSHLREIDPAVHVSDDEAVAYEAEAGYVEAVPAVAAFAAAAERSGAEVCEGVEVTGIQVTGGRVVGVVTTQGAWQSRNVVIAAGPWAARVAATAGVQLPVNACRTQVALFRRPADDVGHLSVYGDFANEIYFKPTWGEMVHVGSIGSHEADAVVDPDHSTEVADETFVQDCRRRLQRRLSTLVRAPGRGGYAALYSITPDWHPILDQLPGIEGLYCAVGFSGHGFKMSPIVGQLMSEWIIDGAPETLDVAPLRLERFQRGELFTGTTGYGVMG